MNRAARDSAPFLIAVVLLPRAAAAGYPVLFDPPTYVESWELPNYPSEPPEYTAMTVARDGSVWVASRIALLQLRDDQVVQGLELPVSDPQGTVDRLVELDDGRLLALTNQYRVWVIRTDGVISESWSPGPFSQGDASSSGLVFIADSGRIKVFDLSGALLRSWRDESARAMTVSRDGRVSYRDSPIQRDIAAAPDQPVNAPRELRLAMPGGPQRGTVELHLGAARPRRGTRAAHRRDRTGGP